MKKLFLYSILVAVSASAGLYADETLRHKTQTPPKIATVCSFATDEINTAAREKWECNTCGEIYDQKPKECSKCGSKSFTRYFEDINSNLMCFGITAEGYADNKEFLNSKLTVAGFEDKVEKKVEKIVARIGGKKTKGGTSSGRNYNDAIEGKVYRDACRLMCKRSNQSDNYCIDYCNKQQLYLLAIKQYNTFKPLRRDEVEKIQKINILGGKTGEYEKIMLRNANCRCYSTTASNNTPSFILNCTLRRVEGGKYYTEKPMRLGALEEEKCCAAMNKINTELSMQNTATSPISIGENSSNAEEGGKAIACKGDTQYAKVTDISILIGLKNDYFKAAAVKDENGIMQAQALTICEYIKILARQSEYLSKEMTLTEAKNQNNRLLDLYKDSRINCQALSTDCIKRININKDCTIANLSEENCIKKINTASEECIISKQVN